MSKTLKTRCRICLRTDFDANDDIEEALEDFHDELCDFDACQQTSLKFCPICECLLRKFYNFKLTCQRANTMLRAYRKRNLKVLKALPSSLSIGNGHNQKVLCLGPDYNENSDPNQNQNNNVTIDVLTYQNVAQLAPSKPIDSEIILLPNQNNEYTNDDYLINFVKDERDNVSQIKHNPLYTDENQMSIVKDEIAEDVSETDNAEGSEMQGDYIGHLEITLKQDPEDDNEEETETNLVKMEKEATKRLVKIEIEPTIKSHVKIEKEATKKSFVKVANKNASSKKDSTVERSGNPLSDNDSDGEDVNKKVAIAKNPDRKAILERVKSLAMTEEDVEYVRKFKLIADKKTLRNVKRTLRLKNKILALLEEGEFQDLEGNVTLNKETFLDMFHKMNKARLAQLGLFNPNFSADMPRLKRFLQSLVKVFDPKYKEIFDIQYMLTREEKLAEFNARRHSEKYLKADYKCDICYKVFDAQALLDYHGKWHEASRAAACDICGMRFMNGRSLKKHCNGDHYSVYRCKLCPLVTWDFIAMANHYDYHSGVKFTCDICNAQFSHKSSMHTHRRTVHAHPHVCARCGRSFSSEVGLAQHDLLKHRDDPKVDASVPCEQCDSRFESQDALRYHLRRAHSTRNKHSHVCIFRSICHYPGCGLSFLTRVVLRKHKLEAGHEHPPEATDAQTPNTQRLKRANTQFAQSSGRKRSRTTAAPPLYKTCPICGVQIRNWCSKALYMHHQGAHPHAPYVHSLPHDILCHLCGMKFHARCTFREHMNTHAGARPFACECGARFARRALLAEHAGKHSERAYPCRECGKRFNTHSNMAAHMRTHIGDRRYKCDLCPKSFLHNSALTAHVKGVHMLIRRVKKKTIPQ